MGRHIAVSEKANIFNTGSRNNSLLRLPVIGHMVTFLHIMKGILSSLRPIPYLPLKLLFSLVNTA